MTWAEMSEPERAALCHRGLEAIFDPTLKTSIGRIIDDVREHGDEAVCRALRDFDRVSLEPYQLRASSDEIESATVSPDVDAAQAVQWWMQSPEHRANILTPEWREIGIAAIHADSAGGPYRDSPVTVITTDFGVRR